MLAALVASRNPADVSSSCPGLALTSSAAAAGVVFAAGVSTTGACVRWWSRVGLSRTSEQLWLCHGVPLTPPAAAAVLGMEGQPGTHNMQALPVWITVLATAAAEQLLCAAGICLAVYAGPGCMCTHGRVQEQ